MDKKELKRVLRLQQDADKKPKKKKIKEPDIFDTVKKRKRDIISRQKTVDNREEKIATELKRMEDAIYRETCQKTVEKSQRKFERRARNVKNRRRIVENLTNSSYKCPACKEVKTFLSQWVISSDCSKIVCRKCFSIGGWDILEKSPLDLQRIKMFNEVDKRFPINAMALCRMRDSLKLSVEQFASTIGWSDSYQYQLERGEHKWVSEKTMGEICQVFSKKGFPIEKNIWGEPKIRYKVNGNLIKTARELKSISQRTFAELAGWSSTYQHNLEVGKILTISKEVADTIVKIIN